MTSSAFTIEDLTNNYNVHNKELVSLVTYSGGFTLGSVLIRYFMALEFENSYLYLSAILALCQLAGISILLVYFHGNSTNISLQNDGHDLILQRPVENTLIELNCFALFS